ncbi:MAG: S8 family serine peptidase [Acidobacteria bacterium]|nr:S8 family serine peptidase [Acidobacteriota bacterium]
MTNKRRWVSTIFASALIASMLWLSPENSLMKADSSPKNLSILAAKRQIKPRNLVSYNRIRVNSEADREAARNLGEIIEDYGSFIVVAIKSENLNSLRQGPMSNLDIAPMETNISLRGFNFDPLTEDPASEFATSNGYLERRSSEPDYHIVQFVGPVKDKWLKDIAEMGGEVVQYIPNQAFFVYADAKAMERIANYPKVRWTGEFQPVYKVHPDMLSAFDGRPAKDKNSIYALNNSSGVFDIAIFSRARIDSISAELQGQGAIVRNTLILPNNYFNVIRAELSQDLVSRIARLKDVIAIDPYVIPTKEDEKASQIIAGNFTGPTTVNAPGYNPQSQFGVNGSNVTVAVVDDGVGIPGNGGFYISSTNAVNAPLRGAAAGADGHGHLQATIIAGSTPFAPDANDAAGYNMGLGVAPSSHIVNVPFLRSGYGGDNPDVFNDIVTTAGPNAIVASVSNHSYGSGTNGNAYDSLAAQHDGFARDSSSASSIDPLTIVFSAGNQGTGGLTRPKVAKNVISVAASENVRPGFPSAGGSTGAADNLEQLVDFSSRGPAADGRVKPDIAAPGDAITGGQSGPDTLFGNIGTNHRISSGTSHAAPLVAGAAALFTQFWKGSTQGAGQNPSPALVKAALINGTVDMTGTGATAARPNGSEGWGRITMKNVLNTGIATKYVNQTVPLTTTGQSITFPGSISSSANPINVTLVWTDPPGVSDPSLVNNLDLEVTAGGVTYKGNVFSGGSSTTGGVADNRNNVENVFLPAGISGPISIRVVATGLNGDGILGDADTTDQHFALVATNFVDANAAIITAAGATITAESCTPGNGVVDPGETITANFSLQNVGNLNTTNLVATLQATGGVTAPSAAQTYGALTAGGSAVSRSFSFTAMGNCGDIITATFSLQDGATNLGTVTFSFQTGMVATALSQNFDGVTAPALPSGFTNTVITGSTPGWTTSTATPVNSSPNKAFAPNLTTVTSATLTLPSVMITSSNAQLSFRNFYNLENNFDGGVLEISLNGGAFQDIIAAGGSFASAGYNGTLNNTSQNPIRGRMAWTGNAGSFLLTTVNLPASAVGQMVTLRFLVASDESVAAVGWNIDDITLLNGFMCCGGGGPVCTFTISPTSQSFTSAGGTGNITVTASDPSCTRTATSNDAFITITSGASGTGSGTVSYTVATNSSTSPRTGTITVAGQTFTVNQAGAAAPNCTFTINPTNASFTSTGGTGNITVTASDPSCARTATSNDAFITVTSGASGTGSGTVSYTVATNSSTSSRTGTITVAGQTFTVNQAGAPGCSFTLNPTSASFATRGGSGSITVTASSSTCARTATSNAAFITITSGASGTGNGIVAYRVAVNNGAARTGTITVGDQTFTVNQAGTGGGGGACTFTINPTNASFTSTGGTGNITVTASSSTCARTATSNAAFITITSGASGTGSGTVSYTVATNSSTSSRTGTITVAGQTFTVTQAGTGGGGGCTFTLNPTSASFAFRGGSGSITVTASSSSCARTATSNAAFITITSGASGTGNGIVTYTVSANLGSQRTGTITVGGQTFTVTQAGR